MGPRFHPNPAARPPAPPARRRRATPPRAAATPRLDETSEEGAQSARGKSRRGRRTGHDGEESPRSGGFTIHIPNPLKMLSRRTSQHPDGLTSSTKAKSTRNFQSITPPEGELTEREQAEVAATAAALVKTVSGALEANGGGIHEKHTTPPRAYTASSTISQLSRGSSSHVRLDDVTGGASAMVAAPVPAERLSQVVPSEGAPLDSDESSGIERTMTMSV